MLAAIREECECNTAAAGATTPEDQPSDDGSGPEAGAAAPLATTSSAPALTASDVHVLLDCLALPAHRNEAVAVVKECAVAARLHIDTFAECLEERQRPTTSNASAGPSTASENEQQAWRDAEDHSHSNGADGDETHHAAASTSSFGPSSAISLLSSAQRAFVAAHPLATDPGNGPIPQTIAEQLRLAFPENESPSGLPSLAASASADELGGLLSASEVLIRIDDSDIKRFAAQMLLTLHRHFNDPAAQRRVLRCLAHVALSGGEAPAVPSTAANAVSGDGNAAVSGVGSIPAPALASSLLATLASQSPGGGSLVLCVVLELAADAQQQAQHAQHDVVANATRHAQELAAQRSVVTKAETALRRAQDHVSELESAIARRTAEHAAELAGLASDRKELQAQLRSAEQQVEWVKSERDEERTVRARESRDAAQRLAEAEAQLTRLKATRRDEQKRAQKDRSMLNDRLREMEDACERAEAEAARARGDASLAVSRGEKAAQEARRRIEGAEHAVKQRDAELAAMRNAAAERDAHLRASLEAQRSLEQHLAAERQRVALLTTGAGLETASPGELKTVAGVLEASLRRVNGMLMGPGGDQGNRMSAPLGGVSPGSSKAPGGFRQAPGQQQQPPPPHYSRPMHSLGGHSSLDSMGSLQGSDSGPGGGGGGLFGGPEWGLAAAQNSVSIGHSNNNNNNGRLGGSLGPGQEVDSASMEKLLGLLPSDLLHS